MAIVEDRLARRPADADARRRLDDELAGLDALEQPASTRRASRPPDLVGDVAEAGSPSPSASASGRSWCGAAGSPSYVLPGAGHRARPALRRPRQRHARGRPSATRCSGPPSASGSPWSSASVIGLRRHPLQGRSAPPSAR